MSDKPIYYLLDNYISPCLCFIHPNIITILGGILSIFLCINIIYKKDILVAILLAFLIQLCDCLDGSIARTCNKQSKFGALLDNTVDILKFTIITLSFLIVLFQFKFTSVHYIVVSFVIIFMIYFIIMWFVKEKDSFTQFCANLGYNNSILFFILYTVIIKVTLTNMKKK